MKARVKSSVVIGIVASLFGVQSVGPADASDTPPPVVVTDPSGLLE